MKNLILIFTFLFVATNCHPQKSIIDPKADKIIKPEKNDDGEWELIVFDAQYDTFLNSIARPRSMFSESTLKTKNSFLVSEWNSYYYSGRYRNIIESSIEYDSHENYGFEFEYRLYQVFAYVNWKYGLRFTNLSGIDAK